LASWTRFWSSITSSRPISGLRYKVDRNHNLVYLELNQPTITFREIRGIFRKLALDPHFIGAIPAELRPKTKTQPLDV
jgi:hypothetical protein